jgi:transketolase
MPQSANAPESRGPETKGEALGRNARTTEEVALGIRRRVFEHTIRNNGGYLSQACSAAEQLAWLYNEELHIGESTLPLVPEPFGGVPSAVNTAYHSGAGYNGPAKPEYDRLIIAPAHYALVTYATLVEVGRMAPEGLKMFNQDGSSVEMIGAEHCPGMEMHNGTLGVGLSTAAGLAWGRRRNGDTGRVWVFMSDGEVQEGQTWEAVQAAAYHRIDTLSAIVDVNDQQCDGAMASVMDVRSIKTKLEAFGAVVAEINGHDLGEMRDAARTSHPGQPLIILAHTSPYQGMKHLERRFPRLHYVRFTSEEDRAATNAAISAELGVPPVAYAH